jgi:hypothetical protein
VQVIHRLPADGAPSPFVRGDRYRGGEFPAVITERQTWDHILTGFTGSPIAHGLGALLGGCQAGWLRFCECSFPVQGLTADGEAIDRECNVLPCRAPYIGGSGAVSVTPRAATSP